MKMYKRKEIIGDCQLFLGDCLDIMPTLGKVDAVVTDPPYGLGIDGQKESVCRNPKQSRKGYDFKGWDATAPVAHVFDSIFLMSDAQIIWGGNYFQDKIHKIGRGWLIWDKGQHGLTMSDGEAAYCSLDKPLRIFTKNRAALLSDGAAHPTQKPVSLMKWCLEQLPDAQTILDPFMGSGSTLVACAKMGKSGIGIELDETYFDIACRRIEEAYRQPDMFLEMEKQDKAAQEQLEI